MIEVPRHKPNQSELLALLDYNPETGTLTWKERISGPLRKPGGKPAGSTNGRGYRSVEIGKRAYLVHRVVWCMMTGDWPTLAIDHINGDPVDNRWMNLREANPSQNAANARCRNRFGVKGVELARHGGYRVKIKRKHLGYFRTLEEARDAYDRASKEVFGKFARME